MIKVEFVFAAVSRLVFHRYLPIRRVHMHHRTFVAFNLTSFVQESISRADVNQTKYAQRGHYEQRAPHMQRHVARSSTNRTKAKRSGDRLRRQWLKRGAPSLWPAPPRSGRAPLVSFLSRSPAATSAYCSCHCSFSPNCGGQLPRKGECKAGKG